MPPRSARKKSAGRKKSTSSSLITVAATGETETAAVESPLPEEKTVALAEAEAVVVKVEEEKDTEHLVEEAVKSSNPNPVEIENSSIPKDEFVWESMINDEVLVENWGGEGMDVVSNENGTMGKDKEDLGHGCENADEEKQGLEGEENQGGVGSPSEIVSVINLAQEETATAQVVTSVVPHDINDGDGEGEGIAETISAHADNASAPSENNPALAVKHAGYGEGEGKDGDGEVEGIAETISVHADNASAPSVNNPALAVKHDGYGEGEGKESEDDGKGNDAERHNEGDDDPSRFVQDILVNPSEIISAQESAQADGTKEENDTDLAINNDVKGQGEGKESGDDGESDEDGEGDNEDNGGDEDPSLFVQDALINKKKNKDIEIYVGRLDRRTVEHDLVSVFQKYGELKSTRIVRNPNTKRSKGYAFIRFASVEQTKHALSELKDGVEVKGKRVTISASQENDTLYVGNICKTWTKEDVLQQLKYYGIEHIEEIHLPNDPNISGELRGFAFLEFSNHPDAIAAFRRLQKPDAVFGCDRSAKVAFTQIPMPPSEEVLSQVKQVYIEGLTGAWNKEKVREICKHYGEIVKISLCQSPGIKHKDYGFVTFTSHESALACVKGIHDAHIEGEVEIKASIAEVHHKGTFLKQGFRGGFKVEKKGEVSSLGKEGENSKVAESSEMKGDLNSQRAKRKRETPSKQKGKALPKSRNDGQSNPKKPKGGSEGQIRGRESKSVRTNRKRKASESESREERGIKHTVSKPLLKIQKGNMRGRERDNSGSGNPKRDTRIRKRRDGRNPARYGHPRPQGYTASTSTSTIRNTEMEPHAGYIAPASTKQSRPYTGYVEPVVRTRSQQQTVYFEPAAGSPSHLHPRYVDHPVVTQSHRAYIDTRLGAQIQYRQPAIVQIAHDPCSPGFARAAQRDVRGARAAAYVGGPPLSASYVPNNTSYAGYQAGGDYAHSIPRRYY